MKVSIVIPAYNEEHHIAAAITAALSQTYPGVQVIVVDNASTDRTGEIARSFPVTVVREDRKGLLYARECGRCAAAGADIIANTDADCIPDPDWIAAAVKHFEKESVVAVSGPCDFYDAQPLLRWFLRATFNYITRPLNDLMQLPIIHRRGYLNGGNNLVRSRVLEAMGGYDTSIAFWGEDVDTANRVSKYGRVVFDSKIVVRTSGRRFANQGVLKTFYRYIIEFLRR